MVKVELFKVYIISILFSAMVQVLTAQETSRVFDLVEFSTRAVGISDLKFTPDGEFLMYRLQRTNMPDNRYETTYQLLNVQDTTQQIIPLPPGATELSFDQNGDLIGLWNGDLYVWSFPELSVKWTLDMGAQPIMAYAGSPSGSTMALSVREAVPNPVPAHLTAFEVGPHGYLDEVPYLPNHIHLYDRESNRTKRSTAGDWSVSSAPHWSTNGKALFFMKKDHPNPSQWHRMRVMRYDFESDTLTPFTTRKAFEYAVQVNGDAVVVSTMSDQNPAGMRDWLSYTKGTDIPQNLTAAWDYEVDEWVQTSDGWVVTGKSGTLHGVWSLKPNGKMEVLKTLHERFVITEMAWMDGQLAFVGAESNKPAEIYLLNRAGELIQLTHYHQFLTEVRLPLVETVSWMTDVNIQTDGVLTYPVGYHEGEKYPLVLLIHGGPTSSSMESFNARAVAMASKGWIVFQPNYRGSDNRGEAFQEAIANDGGEGPGRDVMAGVEYLQSLGLVDEEKIAVTGWSYGGFMTAWMIGRYPNVWKCAVAGAPPVDFTDMTSLSRMNLTLRHAITQSPWVGDNYQQYFDMSPLKYFNRIQTPTLVMSKVQDQVVAVTGSYKLYHALLANKIPTQFVAYPGGGHFPSDPVNRLDVSQRWIGWVARWFGD